MCYLLWPVRLNPHPCNGRDWKELSEEIISCLLSQPGLPQAITLLYQAIYFLPQVNVFWWVKVVAEIYRPKHHLRNGPITRIICVWAHLWNIITSIFQNLTSSQLCFIMISRSMNTLLSVSYREEQEHESPSPVKQLFSTPCLFELSCKELLENIYMLALSFLIKHPVA